MELTTGNSLRALYGLWNCARTVDALKGQQRQPEDESELLVRPTNLISYVYVVCKGDPRPISEYWHNRRQNDCRKGCWKDGRYDLARAIRIMVASTGATVIRRTFGRVVGRMDETTSQGRSTTYQLALAQPSSEGLSEGLSEGWTQ